MSSPRASLSREYAAAAPSVAAFLAALARALRAQPGLSVEGEEGGAVRGWCRGIAIPAATVALSLPPPLGAPGRDFAPHECEGEFVAQAEETPHGTLLLRLGVGAPCAEWERLLDGVARELDAEGYAEIA